ncbi:hypothetical protein SAMN05216302_101110 [Nitrosomonas aestuarii]|uniref:Uncharacterized protein n=1 Tax=Nitrosomonas aestuarii TaxID=52441 RepID=A0A1I4B5U9_9PROT|nr:hypothetical protein [Nitrosomonas aestuarii]SFK63279.1 hypothetical protein SAMN05216302_101110 [Nitrosomonas aestuarii]
MSMKNILRQAINYKEESDEGLSRELGAGGMTLDDADHEDIALDAAADHSVNEIKMQSVAAIHQWLETDDLDDGETSSDRLFALMVGIADADKDGELTDDEQDTLDIALEGAWDYLSSKGVDDEDIDALLNDWDDDAAERIRDLVASVMPDGEDEEDSEIASFVFDNAENIALDAVYKKKIVVRKGKKVRIRKRVAGRVRLSGKQKLAIKKAQRKSRTAGAKMRRKKSMKIRKRSGLK